MDHIELSLEQSLDSCIKCTICTSACPVVRVTDRFPGPKYVGPQAQRFRTPEGPSPDSSVDYCSGCRICNMVCPTGVRIAELNARARAGMVERDGLSLRNRLLGRSELLGRLGTPVAPLANWALRSPLLRLVAERLLGIHRRAPLPAFAGRTFRRWMHRRPAASGARTLVYFHGCSTNYYEPHVGQAAVEVLERQGFRVLTPAQGCCGLPMISNGEFRAARRYHQSNVRHLLPYLRAGYPIVGSSTSCTLTLKEEAPEVLGMHGEEVALLASQTYDLFEFLRLLHERGELSTSFAPLERTVFYHAPCQLKAHRIGQPVLELLRLIPGLTLIESGADCCGIAGTYGLKREKYQVAMDVGAPLFEAVRRSGCDLALTDSETCRWQISHATGLPCLHPVELLRQAYG